jgi:hypothetical protein
VAGIAEGCSQPKLAHLGLDDYACYGRIGRGAKPSDLTAEGGPPQAAARRPALRMSMEDSHLSCDQVRLGCATGSSSRRSLAAVLRGRRASPTSLIEDQPNTAAVDRYLAG